MLDEAAGDDRAEAIVLHMDTPGGTVTGTPETSAQIAYISEHIKPVVAFTDGGANSAGYYLAAPCWQIVASHSARVGSIGVYMALLDSSVAYEINGYKQELFASGKYKGMGLPGLPLTDAQKDHLQREVDALYADFRDVVRAGRPDVADESMQGQTFRAIEALDAGLIDVIGGLETAITIAREAAQNRSSET
jgi:signal peptide peptidase SppA